MVVVGVVVAVSDGEIYYFIVVIILFYCDVYITPSVSFFFVLFEKSNFLREHHLLSCLPFKNV